MAGYTREFLVSAFMSRYQVLGADKTQELRALSEKYYDEVGRDKFRVSASLDAEAVKKFKLDSGRKS